VAKAPVRDAVAGKATKAPPRGQISSVSAEILAFMAAVFAPTTRRLRSGGANRIVLTARYVFWGVAA
jgi:hypothetical protein